MEQTKHTGVAGLATLCLVLLALMAAWLLKDAGLLSRVPPGADGTPDVAEGEALGLYQAAFTGWAALLLLIPTYIGFWFRNVSAVARSVWLAFWTFGAIAYLIHLAFSMFGFFGGDFAWMTSSTRVSAFWPGMIIAVWWPLDALLAHARDETARWIRVQRIVLHVIVLILFVGGSLGTGELMTVRVLGLILLITALGSLVRWVITRGSRRASEG
ncbi:MAG: hypothetical protein AAFY03_04400 [Pseudomonadota bacterium]